MENLKEFNSADWLETIQKIKNVVVSTMGGKSSYVYNPYTQEYTRDGVSVLKNINDYVLPKLNKQEQVIFSKLYDCARKTELTSGDGTTTTTIIFTSICIKLAQVISTSSFNKLDLFEGLRKGYELFLQYQKEYIIFPSSLNKNKNKSIDLACAVGNWDIDENDTKCGHFFRNHYYNPKKYNNNIFWKLTTTPETAKIANINNGIIGLREEISITNCIDLLPVMYNIVKIVDGDGVKTGDILYLVKIGWDKKNESEISEKLEGIFKAHDKDIALYKVITEEDKNEFNDIGSDLYLKIINTSTHQDIHLSNAIFKSIEPIIGLPHFNILISSKTKIQYDSELLNGFKLNFGCGSYGNYAGINFNEYGLIECDNPYLLIYDDEIKKEDFCKKIMELCMNTTTPLVIICKGIEPYCRDLFNYNKPNIIILNSKEDIVTNRIDMQQEYFNYYKIITGTLSINNETFEQDKNILTKGNLKKIKSVRIGMEYSIIECDVPEGNLKKQNEQINSLINQLDNDISLWNINYVNNLLELICNKLVIFYLNSNDISNKNETQQRIEDAILAYKSAKKYGVVPGTGIINYIVSLKMDEYIESIRNITPDIAKGMEIISDTLKEPITTLFENSNIKNVLQKINSISFQNNGKKPNEIISLDVNNNEFVNLVDKGILDSAEVTQRALKNSIESAIIINNTSYFI